MHNGYHTQAFCNNSLAVCPAVSKPNPPSSTHLIIVAGTDDAVLATDAANGVDVSVFKLKDLTLRLLNSPAERQPHIHA
jgi:hypothetical protein